MTRVRIDNFSHLARQAPPFLRRQDTGVVEKFTACLQDAATCACYLARAELKGLVLERYDAYGGKTISEGSPSPRQGSGGP